MVHDTESGKGLLLAGINRALSRSIASLPDGQTLAFVSGETVQFWEMPSERMLVDQGTTRCTRSSLPNGRPAEATVSHGDRGIGLAPERPVLALSQDVSVLSRDGCLAVSGMGDNPARILSQ